MTAPSSPDTGHYLGAIRRKLERLYDVYPNDPVLREQISDEVDWIDAEIERSKSIGGPVALDDLISLTRGCPYDGGFDSEIGPIGCCLDVEGMHGCVCRDIVMGAKDRLKSGPAQPTDLVYAFRNADAGDWEHLDLLLGHSGHGKFWRAVFEEVRAALAPGNAGAVEAGRVPDRETFWLLEMVGQQKWALWTSYSGDFVHSWTDDAWRAGRFNNERHAHNVWRSLSREERDRWKPVEHMFINKVAAPLPATQGEDT